MKNKPSFHTNNDRKKKKKENDNYIRGLNKYEEVDFDKLFFIHIPKNAGTSIENVGSKNNYLWGKEYNFNMDEDEIQNLVQNKSIWHLPPKYLPENKNPYKKYTNFAIVRNPYDRMVSEYKYYKNMNNTNLVEYDINDFVKYVKI